MENKQKRKRKKECKKEIIQHFQVQEQHTKTKEFMKPIIIIKKHNISFEKSLAHFGKKKKHKLTKKNIFLNYL